MFMLCYDFPYTYIGRQWTWAKLLCGKTDQHSVEKWI